jgi:hypothetical protein
VVHLAGVLPIGDPAGIAAPAPPESTPTPAASPVDPTTIGDDRVAPEILTVAVSSPEYDAAMATYRNLTAQLDQARATYDRTLAALVELDAQRARLRRQIDTGTQRREEADDRIRALHAVIDDAAVTTYMHGSADLEPDQEVDWEDATVRGSRRAFTEAIVENQVAELAVQTDRRARADREVSRATLLLGAVEERRAETIFIRDSSLAAAFVLATELDAQEGAVADARLTAPLARADFSFNVLDAYVKAAKTLQAQAPACGIRWEILAGISRTEGRHGTYRGSHVEADGQVIPEIIGIPLDGTNDTAAVGDSDGGQWDGDAVHDRAVGPMQFIPSSWRSYGADGNGDGEIDPHNMYDAALAAANLLCRRSAGLDTAPGLADALGHYNNSREYIRVVSDRIAGYDALELL